MTSDITIHKASIAPKRHIRAFVLTVVFEKFQKVMI
jgi:hypothetical protein